MKSKLHNHPTDPYPPSSQHHLLLSRLQSHWPSLSVPVHKTPSYVKVSICTTDTLLSSWQILLISQIAAAEWSSLTL